MYLCGYAVELALRARICQTLRWAGFPQTGAEFQGLQSVQAHNLEILLRLSGIEQRNKSRYMAAWSVVLDWDPDKRYQLVGQSSATDANDMAKATAQLLRTI